MVGFALESLHRLYKRDSLNSVEYFHELSVLIEQVMACHGAYHETTLFLCILGRFATCLHFLLFRCLRGDCAT